MVVYWQNSLFTNCEIHCNYTFIIYWREIRSRADHKEIERAVRRLGPRPFFSFSVFSTFQARHPCFIACPILKKIPGVWHLKKIAYFTFYNKTCVFYFWKLSFNIQSIRLHLIWSRFYLYWYPQKSQRMEYCYQQTGATNVSLSFGVKAKQTKWKNKDNCMIIQRIFLERRYRNKLH